MNSICFQFAKGTDWLIHKMSCDKFPHSSSQEKFSLKALLKDGKRRPRFFVYVNLILCSLNIGIGFEHGAGLVRPIFPGKQRLFLTVLIAEWILGNVLLIFGYKRRSWLICQVWCVLQLTALAGVLFLTLLRHVRLSVPAYIFLALVSSFQLCGIWVLYYFSLECHSDQRHHNEYIHSSEEPTVKYTTKKPPPRRRGTDQTSISVSSSSSKEQGRNDRKMEEEEDHDPFESYGNSFASSPATPTFEFFEGAILRLDASSNLGREPQYSQVTITSGNLTTTTLPGNIIMSDLMCGGTSTLNKNANDDQ